MAIIASCPMFQSHKNGKTVFIHNNKEFIRRTIEETCLSAIKEVSKSKIKKHAKYVKQFLKIHS